MLEYKDFKTVKTSFNPNNSLIEKPNSNRINYFPIIIGITAVAVGMYYIHKENEKKQAQKLNQLKDEE
jgi:uncharacterized protein HemX